jgi:RNA-directed DNA polymerase
LAASVVAITRRQAARAHPEGTREWTDLVCHQRLPAKLAERVRDRRLLVLIGRMLTANVVLPDGVVIDSEQGVPLSPLLSNIVLDELDQELARRGHRFVRYADDATAYVGYGQDTPEMCNRAGL